MKVGSVSWGTMRPEHLIPAFETALRELSPEQAIALLADQDKWTGETERSAYGVYYTQQDLAHYYLDDLFDALDDHSPEYFYFGSHPGDGADFGWWLCEELELGEEACFAIIEAEEGK